MDLERAAHDLERATATRDIEALFAWLVALDGVAEARVARSALASMPEDVVVAELQREIERRLRRRVDLE